MPKLLASLLVLGSAAVGPVGPDVAVAQAADERIWSLDARAGIALPAGELAEIQGAGPAFGVGVGYFIDPRVALRVDLGLDLLPGEATFFANPDLDAWHVRGGASYRLTGPDAPLFVDAGAGAGVTVISFDDDRGGETDFSYELVGRVGRAIAENADVALRSSLQFVDVTGDTWTIWQIQAALQLWN